MTAATGRAERDDLRWARELTMIHKLETPVRHRFSTVPPSDPRACPPSLGKRGIPRPLPLRPLPVNSPHNSRSLSTHGLHMLSHPDSRHHHFFEIPMHFPRMPPPLANCSSLEVMDTVPGLQLTIYMCSRHGITQQLSWRLAETFPAHVTDIPPCSQVLPF